MQPFTIPSIPIVNQIGFLEVKSQLQRRQIRWILEPIETGDCKIRGCWQEMRKSQHVPDSLELELEQMMDDTGLCKSDFELILLWFQTKLRWESISIWQCQWFHGFCVVQCRIPGIIRSWIFSFFHPLIMKALAACIMLSFPCLFLFQGNVSSTDAEGGRRRRL